MLTKIIKYTLGVLLGFFTFIKCEIMNDNPIFKHQPSDIFENPELEVAKAIRKNNPKAIEQLVKTQPTINLDKPGKGGMTLLFWAAAHRYPNTVEKLLQMGANPNVVLDDGKDKTHIIAMCASGKIDKTFELLLKYNADPNGEMQGTPAIFKTVYARRFDRMRLLLDKGADINAIDKQTDSSLAHFCAKLNIYEQVAYLIEQDADFNRKSNIGGSVAYQVQESRGKLNEHSEKWRTIVEQMLVERGVQFPIPHPYELRKKGIK